MTVKFSGFALLLCLLAGADAQPSERVLRKFPVPGEGGWDFIAADPSGGRLFLSHSTQVQVIDERTGLLLGSIPDTKGVHGIALAPDLKRGFISNGKDSSVTVFDLDSLATLSKIPVTGRNPDAIVYDAYSRRVFVFNGKSDNATVIDASTLKVIGTIPLEGKPEVAVPDGKGLIYLNLEDKNAIAAIDSRTLKVTRSFSIAPGESPSGLAFDAKNGWLFAVCDNKIMVVADARRGKVVATVPIGEHPDGADFDPRTRRAYSSNGDGTLTVVQEKGGRFEVKETVPTQKGARTLALDPLTHHLFLPTAEFGSVPAASADNPRPRSVILPNSFVVLDVGPQANGTK
jgi:YVTN family beta-propeller protein